MERKNIQNLPLVKMSRDNLIEEEHFGFIVRVNHLGEILETFNDSFDTPFYLRSCEKPIQASLAVDYNLDLTEEEYALTCGSNAGEKCHYETALSFAKKFAIKENNLKCGIHKPLSKTRQNEMLLNGEKETTFHNNCVGKHLVMLALCKRLGFSVEDYDEPEHPLQKLVNKKVTELCRLTGKYPVTKDGCGLPVMAMPLKNMVIGFLNLFCDPKYSKLKNAILNNPYLYGGEDRTDTKIIEQSQNKLIAKVGASGLCIVINPEIKEGFIVKISDCDMKSREIVVIDYINRLGWAKISQNKDILTLHGEKVGKIETLFDVLR